MRTSRKLVSVFLALAMAWSLVPSTLAEQAGSGSDRITVSVSVVWDDDENRDSIRPDEVTVQLIADGVAVGEQTLDASVGWAASWEVQKYNDSQEEIYYTVEQSGELDGYSVSISGDAQAGFTIQNYYKPETVDIHVTVVWEDEENAEGIRPSRVEIALFEDGREVDEADVRQENGWECVFSAVNKYSDGQQIRYEIQEREIADYTTTVSGDGTAFTVTNAHEVTKYTVEYDLAGGCSTTEQLVYTGLKAGEETPEIAQPTKEGWSFVGWEPAWLSTVTEDVTYTAQWEETIPEVRLAAIEKEVNCGWACAGEVLVYTVRVTNTGNVKLNQITVTDQMLDKSEEIERLDVGETITFTYRYRVSSSDEGKTLVNTAVVWIDGTKAGEDSCSTRIAETEEQVYDPPTVPQLNREEHFAYIIGKEDGLVHPLEPITRAETATIFFRLLTEASRQQFDTWENCYVDVVDDAWYCHAVSTLTNAGIFTGRSGDRFEPLENITRGELAALVVRFFRDSEVETVEHTLSDVAGHWAEEDIYVAHALGLITGYPDETFRPDQEVTRAEAMTMINRVLGRRPDKKYLLDGMIVWEDNKDPNVWYYADIQEATNSHTYVMRTDKNGEKYEVWKQLIEVRDWAKLETTNQVN